MAVHQFPSSKSKSEDGLASGGNPPYDGDMEKRVQKLEDMAEKIFDRLTGLDRNVAVILSNYCAKEDLHKEINSQTWKLVIFICSFGSALVAAVYFIAKHTP